MNNPTQNPAKPVSPIRFRFTRERTGYRSGPRYRTVVDCTGLDGARFCAAKMINSALLYRNSAPTHRRAEFTKADRLGMRVCALWARVFAGQIDQNDPRLDAVSNARHELVLSVALQPNAA